MTVLQWSRRKLVSAGVASGFASAVLPALGSEILSTSAQGLDCGEALFGAGDIEEKLYYAKPSGAGPFPLVLVVQEIFGLHEHIRDVCRRLAHAGYFAVAPNLYQRQGDPMHIQDISALVRDIVANVPDVQVMADLDACIVWALKQGADPAKMAVTGFCWGGRISWLYAAHNKQLKAGIAWYGRLQSAVTALQPRHPVDVAAELACPVLGLYGGADDGIPQDSVERMRMALRAVASPSQLVVFPDAPHGFNADYRPSYRPEIAAQAWSRMLQWLQSHGVGVASPVSGGEMR